MSLRDAARERDHLCACRQHDGPGLRIQRRCRGLQMQIVVQRPVVLDCTGGKAIDPELRFQPLHIRSRRIHEEGAGDVVMKLLVGRARILAGLLQLMLQ